MARAILAVFSRAARRATLVAAGKPVPHQETADSVVWLNTYHGKVVPTVGMTAGIKCYTHFLEKALVNRILGKLMEVQNG
ncbi:MAG: hypothetical protein WAV28_08855 [Sedimentisphaerales bacterium]